MKKFFINENQDINSGFSWISDFMEIAVGF